MSGISRAEVSWSHPDDEPALAITQRVEDGTEQVVIVLPDEVPELLRDISRTFREHVP